VDYPADDFAKARSNAASASRTTAARTSTRAGDSGGALVRGPDRKYALRRSMPSTARVRAPVFALALVAVSSCASAVRGGPPDADGAMSTPQPEAGDTDVSGASDAARALADGDARRDDASGADRAVDSVGTPDGVGDSGDDVQPDADACPATLDAVCGNVRGAAYYFANACYAAASGATLVPLLGCFGDWSRLQYCSYPGPSCPTPGGQYCCPTTHLCAPPGGADCPGG
jgi:hypothetical protein